MKETLILSLLLASSALYLFYADQPEAAFDNNYSTFSTWMMENKIVYDKTELMYRFAVFSENLQKIEEVNASQNSFTLAINKFAGLPLEEFSQQYTGRQQRTTERKVTEKKQRTTAVPSSLNWFTKGVVAPVQNQGQCGSCWAFSAVSSLESLNAIDSGNLQKFSEQQVVSCAHQSGFESDGCNGGWEMDGFNYVAKYGIESEESYPYVQQNSGKTAPCNYQESQTIYHNTGGEDVKADDPEAMIDQLQIQPLSVAVAASNLGFQFYSKGVVTQYCGGYLDHAVSLVGYNNEPATPNTEPYFIVKNSWGADWGQQGFIWIAKTEGKGTCGINQEPCYPVNNQ